MEATPRPPRVTIPVLTAAEIAAFIGVTPAAIRQVVHRHGIRPAGRGRHRAKLYRAQDVLQHTGTRDRLEPPLAVLSCGVGACQRQLSWLVPSALVVSVRDTLAT